MRYIHLNPLRAGLVPTMDDLDRYPCSGHAVLMGNRPFDSQETTEVLQRFGNSVSAARGFYRRFIEDAVQQGRREELIGGGLRRSQGDVISGDEIQPFDERILGGGDFVEEIRQAAPREKAITVKIPLPELLKRVCDRMGMEPQALLRPSKVRDVAEARAVVCYLAVREFGYMGKDVGRLLHLGPTGVTLATRRGEGVVGKRRDLLSLVGEALEK